MDIEAISENRISGLQPSILQDYAILQRAVPLTFEGKGMPGVEVTVTVGDISVTGRGNETGCWSIALPPLPALNDTTVSIEDGKNYIFRHVAIGDLWYCAGQSNMRIALEDTKGGKEAASKGDDPLLREFHATEWVSISPSEVAQGQWRILEGEGARLSSSIGFFFGQRLRAELNIPIGLINSSSGGTPISSWLSRKALLTTKGATADYDRWWDRVRTIDDFESRFPSLHQEWKEDMLRHQQEVVLPFLREKTAALAAGKIPPPVPLPPLEESVGSKRSPNVLYNAMIAPFVNVPIKGVLWYQGESDTWSASDDLRYRSRNYFSLLKTLINSWRSAWKAENLPFFVVQLANYRGRRDGTLDTGWPLVREAQAKVTQLPEVFTVSAVDLGDSHDIHPQDKRPLASRLAMSVLRNVYGFPLDSESPICCEVLIDCRRARVRVGVEAKIAARDGAKTVEGFSVAGKDQKFHPARAKITDNEIVITSDTEIVAVRYNWDDDPQGNVVGANGLPLLPFRTDSWDA